MSSDAKKFDDAAALKMIVASGKHFDTKKQELRKVIQARNKLLGILNDPLLSEILCTKCKTDIVEALKKELTECGCPIDT